MSDSTLITIQKDNISYHQPSDMLYIFVDGCSLDVCDEIEDVWEQGITVMRTDNKISGIEIYDFKERWNNLPVVIDVQSKKPFQLKIPFTI